MSASAAPRRPATRRNGSRRGSASLEFAVAAPVLLILMGGGFDVGMLLRVQITMASGLTNAVQYANVQGSTVTAAALQSLVQNATGLNGIVATATNPTALCPSGYPVTLSALPANTIRCAGATTLPNKYVTITASYAYVPVLPGLSGLVATTVVRQAVAMVQ